MSKTYTINQIKSYIESQDSLGDVLYNLNEVNLDASVIDTTISEDGDCPKCGSENTMQEPGSKNGYCYDCDHEFTIK